MNIVDPEYSFIQFTEGGSPADCDYHLPVALDDDIHFQTKASLADLTEATSIMNHDQKLYVVKHDAVITDEASLTANTLLSFVNVFDKSQVSATSVILCWSFGLVNVSTLDDNTCFRLCLRLDNGTTKEYYISNCFIKIGDIKYFSTLEYSCEVNNYGFNYCDGCENKVRLPIYLGKPQPVETQTVYVKQTGERQLLKYQGSKEYEMDTDFLPEEIHDKIVVALAHDNVNIVSDKYTGGIRKDGDYSIEWDRLQDDEAPATTKVFATPYLVVNNNCEDCTDDIYCADIVELIAVAEETAVECADINELIAVASEEGTLEGLLTVTLGRSSTQLTAAATGGLPPYHYHFYCVPVGGSCSEFTINNPDQDSSGSVSTNYSYLLYSGVVYNFYVQVTDATLATATDGPNATAMCLDPLTKIMMADGSEKPLKEIKVGDKVMDLDLQTGKLTETLAISLQQFVVTKLYTINGVLKTSEGHINVVKDGNDIELLQSCELLKGDILLTKDNQEMAIESIEVEEGQYPVINLATRSQTFIANGILTHNKLACPE